MNDEIINFLSRLKRKPKIALVKQNIYKDLYNCEFNASARDKLLSSNQRTGPVGLLAAFNPDFYVVDIQPETECLIWEEKYKNSSHFSREGLLEARHLEFFQKDGSYRKQSNFTTDIYSVDWNQYDYVITYDYAIPSKVAKTFTTPIWCNYVTEGFMPSFKQAIQNLPEGYSVNFNHHFRPESELQNLNASLYNDVKEGEHSLDFPYFIQYHGCFHDVLGALPFPRSGIVLDPSTKNMLSESQINELKKFGEVREISGCVWHVMDALINSKYYLRLSDRYVLGNSSVEAVASGCLFVSSPLGIKNRYLMEEEATAHGVGLSNQFENALNIIDKFEKNEDLFIDVVSKQRKRLNYLCFIRPLSRIFKMKALL